MATKKTPAKKVTKAPTKNFTVTEETVLFARFKCGQAFKLSTDKKKVIFGDSSYIENETYIEEWDEISKQELLDMKKLIEGYTKANFPKSATVQLYVGTEGYNKLDVFDKGVVFGEDRYTDEKPDLTHAEAIALIDKFLNVMV